MQKKKNPCKSDFTPNQSPNPLQPGNQLALPGGFQLVCHFKAIQFASASLMLFYAAEFTISLPC